MTMTPTPESDPATLQLLREFLRRDAERTEALAELKEAIAEIRAEQRRFIDCTQKDFTEVKGELQRQDGQITALDARIAGNYRGQAAQIELVLSELRVHGERLANMERAMVENSRDTHTLQGRLIESSDLFGQRVLRTEKVVDALVQRVDELLPSTIENVEAASSG